MEGTGTAHEYTVVLRGPASANFAPGGWLSIPGSFTDVGPADVTFRTRFQDLGLATPMPTDLWAEVRGNADGDLHSVAAAFTLAARGLATVLAFSANAAMEVELNIAYESTPRLRERGFLQVFLPESSPPIVSSRRIHPAATGAVLESLAAHPERERLHRSIAHYAAALARWGPGGDTVALAHLYMAAEALTKAALREHLKSHEVCEARLAEEWGIDKTRLDSEVRRRLVFGGDGECFGAAKGASDGYEHGFLDLGEVHSVARRVRLRCAAHIRMAILRVLGLAAEQATPLTSSPYTTPLGPLAVLKCLWATLVSDSAELAAGDHRYPHVSWESRIKSLELNAKGEYEATAEEAMRVVVAEGVELRPDRFEAWDAFSAPADPDAEMEP